MEQYVGLDVSMRETSIAVRQNGKRVWRGKCPSDPRALADVIRQRAPNAVRIVFETGPLSTWLYHALKAEALPAVCIDARHAKAALDMAPNKTDANDADGLAQIAEIGFYREVRVKGYGPMLMRTLVGARSQLLRISIQLSNQIRGIMKTFGLIVPKGAGRIFESNARALLKTNEAVARVVLPLLETWRVVRARAAELDRQLIAAARTGPSYRLLMTIPGVGAITAVSFVAAIGVPENFKRSRAVGAWLGLTTRRYQSGETDYDGHISRRGDRHLRALVYEAAVAVLTRARTDCALRSWGLKLKAKVGFKRAAVAVARKLSVIMHTMLKTRAAFAAAA
jgi:transposase